MCSRKPLPPRYDPPTHTHTSPRHTPPRYKDAARLRDELQAYEDQSAAASAAAAGISCATSAGKYGLGQMVVHNDAGYVDIFVLKRGKGPVLLHKPQACLF
jgi:hypothetical protein